MNNHCLFADFKINLGQPVSHQFSFSICSRRETLGFMAQSFYGPDDPWSPNRVKALKNVKH